MQRLAVLSDAGPAWAHRRWRAMGSACELVVYAPGAEALAALAVERVAALEACWSRFLATSELSALNRRAGGWCEASPTMWVALDAAREAWALTDGRFDPTVLVRLAELGYDRSFRDVAPDGPPPTEPALGGPTFAEVELDDADRAIRVPAGVLLDLGGIGKGLAADLVADELASFADAVSVSLGGDVAVRGTGPGAGAAWPVPVVDTDGRLLGEFPLVDEAIVQSTTAIRRWRRGERALHHVIDPTTGWPAASDIRSAVVTGRRAALAEAVAKAAIIAGVDDGLALLERAGMDGWLFRADGPPAATMHVRDDLAVAGAG